MKHHISIRTPAELHKIDQVDSIERAVCSVRCRARGLEPCWSYLVDRDDAMEWPNPFCENPSCHEIALEVFCEIEGEVIGE